MVLVDGGAGLDVDGGSTVVVVVGGVVLVVDGRTVVDGGSTVVVVVGGVVLVVDVGSTVVVVTHAHASHTVEPGGTKIMTGVTSSGHFAMS